MSTHRFKLRKGYQRAQVSVQELADDVVITGDDVFETTSAGVAAELDDQPALERAADPAKAEKTEKE